jgi:hypothetical protein
MNSHFKSPCILFSALAVLACGPVAAESETSQPESVQPTSMRIVATNPVLEHKSTKAEHTIRGLGRDVSAEYEVVHPTYTVQLSSWSGKPNHQRWSEFGPRKVISVGQVATLDVKGDRLTKIAVDVPEMTRGYIIVPHHKNLKNPRVAGGEAHVKMELEFFSDSGAELAKCIVESTFGADNSLARNWKASPVKASPRVTISLPTAEDMISSSRCFIVKVAPPGEPDLIRQHIETP